MGNGGCWRRPLSRLPEAAEQILRAPAPFIHAVVQACINPLRPQLLPVLQAAEAQGWARLAGALHAILDGRRERSVLLGLDAKDRVIVEAVLGSIAGPATLPPLAALGDPTTAAPGLAAMISAASRGDVRAFAALADMAEQRLKVGGDMARRGVTAPPGGWRAGPGRALPGHGPFGMQPGAGILDELPRRTPH